MRSTPKLQAQVLEITDHETDIHIGSRFRLFGAFLPGFCIRGDRKESAGSSFVFRIDGVFGVVDRFVQTVLVDIFGNEITFEQARVADLGGAFPLSISGDRVGMFFAFRRDPGRSPSKCRGRHPRGHGLLVRNDQHTMTKGIGYRATRAGNGKQQEKEEQAHDDRVREEKHGVAVSGAFFSVLWWRNQLNPVKMAVHQAYNP